MLTELPKYESPKRVVKKYKGGKYVLRCGEMNKGGMELHAKDADLMATLATGIMEECYRLRWILTQVDQRVGGTIVFDVGEATQPNYEVIHCT